MKSPPQAKPGQYVEANQYLHASQLCQTMHLNPDAKLLLVPEATVNGVVYKCNDVVLLDYARKAFAQIRDVIVFDEECIIVGHKCEMKCFDSHVNGYIVCVTDKLCFFKPDDLSIPWPVFVRELPRKVLLVAPFSLPDIEELV